MELRQMTFLEIETARLRAERGVKFSTREQIEREIIRLVGV
jgi:hypothetical protein